MGRLKRIGILGGMGPEATILLQQKLLQAVPVSDDGGHIPLVIDMNPQVPSRIMHLIEGTGPSPAPVLAKMARRLQVAGAEALAMPCNTAHHYAGAITAAVTVPLLNMIELSVAKMASIAGRGASIGMLASPAVQKTGLFEKALAQRGLKARWPADGPAMLRAIRLIKEKGRCCEARETLFAASGELALEGAETQFIACSEFSLLAGSTAPEARVLDTLDILTGAIRAFSFDTLEQPEIL